MKLNRLILLGLLISTGLLKAQSDFRPGYIIQNSGDTLYGQIDYRGDLLMGSVCKFKGAVDTTQAYAPSDIMAYRFIDSELI